MDKNITVPFDKNVSDTLTAGDYVFLSGTVYVARDAIGEEAYADFKKSDIGDIYGVKGYIFRRPKRRRSLHARRYRTVACAPL